MFLESHNAKPVLFHIESPNIGYATSLDAVHAVLEETKTNIPRSKKMKRLNSVSHDLNEHDIQKEDKIFSKPKTMKRQFSVSFELNKLKKEKTYDEVQKDAAVKKYDYLKYINKQILFLYHEKPHILSRLARLGRSYKPETSDLNAIRLALFYMNEKELELTELAITKINHGVFN